MPAGNQFPDNTPLEELTDDFDYSFHPLTDTWWIKLPDVAPAVGVLSSEHGAMPSASGLTLARPIAVSGAGIWNVVNNDFIKVG